ncbi:nuclear RNA export factor 2-like [Suncus etruscus]|uniref:nuclear RNA export factor 2-like n=1 Tax=Suncus etruscus TaxID=109475 RepID=UPI002110701A|nr:nuclear RNA export factor 2-like [Suncus etruscus]
MSDDCKEEFFPPKKKYRKSKDEENNDGGSYTQRIKRDSSFPDNRDEKNSFSSCGQHRSKKRVNYQYEKKDKTSVRKVEKLPTIEEMENSEDETPEEWFSVTIPNGRRYEKIWLLDSIQKQCSVPFKSVDFHYFKNMARFFVQNSVTACALKEVNCKIFDNKNQKINICVNQSYGPDSVQNKLAPEEMMQLELTLNRRYDISKRSLDLERLRFDSDLMNHDIDIFLNRRYCMSAMLEIIEKKFPNLLSLNLCNNKLYQLDGLSDIVQKVPTIKVLDLSHNKLTSLWEVSKMKTLKIEALRLIGNPFCKTFKNKSSYKRAVMRLFPMLLKLSECKGPRTMEEYVLQFLQQYYMIYDSENRQNLLGVYHEEAYFSLSIPFDPNNPISLSKYFKENRNMKILKDSNNQIQLLKHTKSDILHTLCMLPQTQHHTSSFLLDLWVQTETMLCFSVQGMFKEVKDQNQSFVHAFTRTFITVPASNSSMCIVNDELFVRTATINEVQSAFPTPFASFLITLSKEQQEMVKNFSTQSGMNLQWSHKCLQENQWNFENAAHNFLVFKFEILDYYRYKKTIRRTEKAEKRIKAKVLEEGEKMERTMLTIPNNQRRATPNLRDVNADASQYGEERA